MAAILTAEDVVRRIAAECALCRRAWRRRYSPQAGGGDRAAVWGAIPPGAAPQTAAACTEATVSALILRVSFGHIFCKE